jgi:hypothetical protein
MSRAAGSSSRGAPHVDQRRVAERLIPFRIYSCLLSMCRGFCAIPMRIVTGWTGSAETSSARRFGATYWASSAYMRPRSSGEPTGCS